MTLKKSTAALAVLAAMVTGCGGEDAKGADRKDERSSASAAPTPNATDAAIAQASLLTLSDFPAGWEAKAPDQDDDDEDAQRRLADCVGVPFEDLDQRGHRSKAESKDFVSEDDDEISNSVAVITEQTRTTRAFAIVSSAKYRECALEELKSAMKDAFDDEGYEITDISLNELSFDDFGDETSAFRVTATVEAEGMEIDVIVDYVFVRVGRAVTTITAQATFSPFDSAELSEYVQIAAERLAAELG